MTPKDTDVRQCQMKLDNGRYECVLLENHTTTHSWREIWREAKTIETIEAEHDGVKLKFTVPTAAPDAPIVTNENGGMQSKVDYRFDLIDARAHLHLARIFDYGAKRYAPDNWRLISVKEHINHALFHIYLYLAGDVQDDHLGHAMWRLHAADAVAISEGYDTRQADEKNGEK